MSFHLSRRDKSDHILMLAMHRMHYKQQQVTFGHPQRVPALLAVDDAILTQPNERIGKDLGRYPEAHAMLAPVLCFLSRIHVNRTYIR